MHILIVHQAFAALDEAGGTRHYELAQHLVRAGHTVTVITSPISYLTGKSRNNKIPWKQEEHPQEGITILRTYAYPALHRSFLHRIYNFISFMFSSFIVGLGVPNVTLVWGTSPPIFQGVTAWLLARLKGVPFLFEVRDLWPDFAIGVGVLKNRFIIRLSYWLERFLYSHADRVMVNSPGYVRHVSERGAKRVELIINGAEASMFHPEANGAEYRKENGLEGQFVALYAGAHGMSNDLQVVLEAAHLLRYDKNINIALVGDGKEKANLQAQAAEMGLTNVRFLPPVPKSRMPEVLSAADACIAILKPIDLYRTTYPNKVFDYMAAGRPVVLAIDGVIRDVVKDAGAGIYVEPGNPAGMADAIRQMAADPIGARQMGLAGRKAIEEKYDRARIADQLMEILEDMRRNHA